MSSGRQHGTAAATDRITARPCPLCAGTDCRHYLSDSRRDYHHCRTCGLVFVPPPFHLGATREKAEYDRHQNDPEDVGYRRFLSRLFAPLAARFEAGARGLDFGCGPGPALARMFTEAGFRMSVYDPYYADDPSVLADRYDFISASEVVEHLARPGPELRRLYACLRPGGCLGLMTQMVIDQDAFSRWRYKDDPTHICFFSAPCFHWLAAALGADLSFHGRDVVLLSRPRG